MITVKQARAMLLRHCGVQTMPELLDRASDDAYTAAYAVSRWLHQLSADAMSSRFGDNFGGDPRLPPDIDAATTLTTEQVAEFHRRLHALPKT